MIALFDECPRIAIGGDAPVTSRRGMLLGFAKVGVTLMGLVCLEDGTVSLLETRFFTLDWRYDVTRDRFVDVDALGEIIDERDQ